MSRTFYVRLGDEVSGPVTAHQLREMAAKGTLREADYVRPSDQDKWYVASGVRGLFRVEAQSTRPARTDAPSAHDHSIPPLALPTEGVFDLAGFEHDRKLRRAVRRKRMIPFAIIGILIVAIGLVAILSERRRGARKHTYGPQQESSEQLYTKESENPNRKGLGFSLADIEREWGEELGWYSLKKDQQPGRVTYMAANKRLPGIRYMVSGPPENMTSLLMLVDVVEQSPTAELRERLVLSAAMLSKVSIWDTQTVAAWMESNIQEFAHRPDVWRAADHYLRRGYNKLWMSTWVTREGILLLVGVEVTGESERTDESKSSVAPTGEFVYLNVSSRREPQGGSRVIGEITNNSGRSFQFATFTLNVYDSQGRLLDTAPIIISNFSAGHTKSFSAQVDSLPAGWKFKIDFDNGFE